MVSRRSGESHWNDMAWSAVIGGVFASLVVQILLTMLGIGVGLVSLDTQTASNAPLGVSWGAFLWWAVSGIVAAFVGGWVAGVGARSAGPAYAMMAWAITVVIVVGATTFAAGTTSIAASMAGPTATALSRLDAATETRSARSTTGQTGQASTDVESARRAVAAGMLASFVALLIGAAAAFAGGRVGESRSADAVVT